ncbi:hypothetical protein A0U96_15205 [Lactiplantibacillus plantarum]|nr:hypothetical protein A0U96_15205 [Lactiplantibacillus plantarum]
MNVLQFNGYKVNHMSYRRNEHFKPLKKSMVLKPKVTVKVEVKDNIINIILTVAAGSLESDSVPFQVDCSIVGNFTYNPDEDNKKIGLDTFVRNNAVAILYPYARAIIATLTTTSNEFPGYIMPTINVNKLLTQQDKK